MGSIRRDWILSRLQKPLILCKDEINSINSCVFPRCAGTKSSKLFHDLARNLDKRVAGVSVAARIGRPFSSPSL